MVRIRPTSRIQTATAPKRTANRRGISTVWIIASVPALLTLLCLVLEVANLWLARVELKNAVDAAALSGVKTWGEGSSTAAARTETQSTAAMNTVVGTAVALDLNSGAGTNGNGANTGDILLGTISGTPGALTFNCNGTPSCITGTVNLTIAVETDPSGDTFANPSEPTGDAETSFRIESFTQSAGTGAELQSIEFDLSPMMVTPVSGGGAGIPVSDDGFFDLRAIGTNDVNRSIGNPNTKPSLIGRNFSGTAATFNYTGGNGVDQFDSVLVTFGTPLSAGLPGTNQYFFGTDTDRVGGDIGGGGGVTAQDFGGEFGTDGGGGSGNDPFTSTGATVRVTVSGQTFTGTLTRVSADRSELVLVGNLTGGDAFGVRAQTTMQVNSICSSLFGVTVGPFNVTAKSYARFVCSDGPPELVRIQTLICP